MKHIFQPKFQKGERGYIADQKKRRIVVTAILFGISLLIYATGLIQTKTRLNLFTFVAIMGCLPASKSAVGMIMMLMQRPVPQEVWERTSRAAKEGIVLYELIFTAYEKNTPVDCLYISGSHVTGYSGNPKADAAFLEKHLQEILKKAGRSRDVKIYKDFKPFLERVQSLEARRDPADPRFRTLEERNQDVRDTLLSIAL